MRGRPFPIWPWLIYIAYTALVVCLILHFWAKPANGQRYSDDYSTRRMWELSRVRAGGWLVPSGLNTQPASSTHAQGVLFLSFFLSVTGRGAVIGEPWNGGSLLETAQWHRPGRRCCRRCRRLAQVACIRRPLALPAPAAQQCPQRLLRYTLLLHRRCCLLLGLRPGLTCDLPNKPSTLNVPLQLDSMISFTGIAVFLLLGFRNTQAYMVRCAVAAAWLRARRHGAALLHYCLGGAAAAMKGALSPAPALEICLLHRQWPTHAHVCHAISLCVAALGPRQPGVP